MSGKSATFSGANITATAAQIVIAARFYAKRLAKLTKERFALPIVRAALSVDPPLRRRFEFYYRQA